jgi:hypothetical protein
MHDQDKERFLAIVVIIVIILGALGYFLWNFALNKGTIIFKGNPLYTITVDNKDYDCRLETCELVIKEGTHSYKITKPGYNTLGGSITIARSQKLNINADLIYIPILSKPQTYTVFGLPEGYAKFKERLSAISLFKTYDTDYPLNRLPKIVENIVFSKSGEKALIFEKDQVSTYQVADYTINKIEDLAGALNGAFSEDENFFYTIAFDEDAGKAALKRVSFNGETFENIVFFTRNIDDYNLVISPDQKFAVMADNTGETTVVYLIDLIEKARTNVYEGAIADLGQFTNEENYFVFKARTQVEEKTTMKYLDVISREVMDLPFDGELALFDFSQGPFAYFVSDSAYENRGVFVDFVPEQLEDLTVEDLFADRIEQAKPSYLFKWDPVLNEYFMIANLDDFFKDIKPIRIEAATEGKEVRFLAEENVYDLALGE